MTTHQLGVIIAVIVAVALALMILDLSLPPTYGRIRTRLLPDLIFCTGFALAGVVIVSILQYLKFI